MGFNVIHKKLIYILFFISFTACYKAPDTIEEYTNHPVEYEKKEYIDSKNNFSLTIPINWELETNQYNNGNVLFSFDIKSKKKRKRFL